MQRITITIDDELAHEIDKLAQSRGYQNRSETVRDLVRAGIVQTQHDGHRAAECVASVVYVYDQGTRELPKRLAHAYQEQHDLSVATVRVALDHDTCMEVAVLKGKTAEVERFAERIIAERGVRHGRVVTIPAEIESARHGHGQRQPHAHQHIRVR
jgi:CopG family transcriptional regulator, nickel-responsive regulator